MTEKRFYIDTIDGGESVLTVNGVELGLYETCDLLNEQYEENEQLKKQLDETIEGLHKEITTSENAFEGLMNENKELRDACKNYDWYKLYNQLLNENEQLKTTIQQLTNDNTKQKKKLNTAMKENEHIKTTIKDMINTERTEIEQSVLRQLWEAIQ